MILLDTNVLAEPFKPRGASAVLAWLDAQAAETLCLSTITLAEVRFGIAALPDGRRREALAQQLDTRVLPAFADRILPFDADAAASFAMLRARARAAGRAIGPTDGYIAAIAASRGLIVATRDTSPFEAAGVPVINPWQAGEPLV